MKNDNKYDDIINLPHPVSKKHPQMSMYDRAAQFSSFAALVGYEDEIVETSRLTDRKINLSEDEKELLNQKLQIIIENNLGEKVKITYFVPDNRKNGGKYITCDCIVKGYDEFENVLVLSDKSKISISNILNIESEIFNQYNI